MFRQKRVRTPTLIQLSATECGAASLGIILAHYGRNESMANLRDACGVSRDGSRATNILKAAERYGLEAGGFSCVDDLQGLQEFQSPYIMYWQFNHFVVVEGASHKGVFINDPANGHRCLSWSEFDDGFTGVVLTMTPGPSFQRGGSKPSTSRALLDLISGHWNTFFFCVMCGLMLAVIGLVVPACSLVFIDEIIGGQHRNWLRPLLLAMVVSSLLQIGIKHLQLTFLRRFQLTLAAKLAGRLVWHVLRLPIAFYTQRYPGEIASRSLLCDKLSDSLSGRLVGIVIDLVAMSIYAVVMMYFDVTLALIGIGFSMLNIVALQLVSRFRSEANLALSNENGKLMSNTIAGLNGLESLKSLGLESAWFGKWADQYAKVTNNSQRLAVSDNLLNIAPVLLQALAMALILIVGAFRVMDGEMTIGMLVAFQSLMMMFLAPVNSLVGFGGVIQELSGDLRRLDDVLESERERIATPYENPTEIEHRQTRIAGEVKIDNLSFGYSPLDPPGIKGFGCHVDSGEWLAIVGASGSGKSTVAKLIAGLYEPWEGVILLGGRARSEWNSTVLSHSLAIVDQNIMLFEGTVRENLSLWDPTIDESDLFRACRDACIHDDIMALPQGYDTSLLEGGMNLSGGQRQRIEIARALVRNPTVVVLDEATSALDAATEEHVMKNMKRRGCTCIIIAHRLSTFRDAGEILVLDRGAVIEQGSHHDLLKQNGAYSALIAEEVAA